VRSAPEPKSLLSRFVGASLLALVAAIALTLAFDLLTKIWLWLLLTVVLGALVAVVVWVVRRRRDRW
jgi:tetrahydromethanopterin S-methyltransferase subunit E